MLHAQPGWKRTTHFEYVGDAAVFAEGASPRIHLCSEKFPNNHRLEGVGLQNSKEGSPRELKTGIHMTQRRKSKSPQDSQQIGLAFHDGNQRAELVAQADLMLARYPAYVREQITELLRVLAAKPGEAEKGVRIGAEKG